MATVKDWIKVLIASMIGALGAIVVTSMVNYPGNIKRELKTVERNANHYTDKVVNEHEEKEELRFKSIDLQQQNQKNISDKTYKMVEFLYQRELNRTP